MSEASDTPRFIVGLGNPGRQYARTRHNVGFDVVDVLRGRWQWTQERTAFQGLFSDGQVGRTDQTRRVGLLKPGTYMNGSGRAVAEMTRFYKADPSDVLVVLDDMAIPLASLRMRAQGSAGSHNGLADVLAALGTNNVPRLRIGIGAPPGRMAWKDFVLTKFRPDEREQIDIAVQDAADAAETWLFQDIEQVMNETNRPA